MIGAGTLLRVLGKSGTRFFDRLGIMPPRWFLRQALDALSEDDLPLVIRSLTRVGKGRSHHWELIRQQAVFRCRILKDTHAKALQRLEGLKESAFLVKLDRNDLRQAMDLHCLAIRILSNYEDHLQELDR
jgi:hypothetical protein